MPALQELGGGWHASASLFARGERKHRGAEDSLRRAILHEDDDVNIFAFPIGGQA